MTSLLPAGDGPPDWGEGGHFPSCRGPPPGAATAPGPAWYPSPSAVKVLIADDDRLVRIMLADLLAELGHTAIAAANGAEAVALCASERPDVVVLDLLMPRLSGLDAVRALRQAGSRVPAILLTAISDRSFREMDGAEEVQIRLDKPVTRRALVRALERATGGG